MRKIGLLMGRHIRVFLRDRAAVFFSLLFMLILLGVMSLFLGKVYMEDILEVLAAFGSSRDRALDEANIKNLMMHWILAGVLTVNSLSVTMSALGTMISDRAEKKLQAFYCAPIHRMQLAVSYIAAAVGISLFFNFLVFGIGTAVLACRSMEVPGGAVYIRLFGALFVQTLVFAILIYMLTLLVRSTSAWSGASTILGTLVGFLGAIYLPVGNLPEGVVRVLKSLPILQGVSILRRILCEEGMDTLFAGLPSQVSEGFAREMGITVSWQDASLSIGNQYLILGAYGILGLTAVLILSKGMRVTDR